MMTFISFVQTNLLHIPLCFRSLPLGIDSLRRKLQFGIFHLFLFNRVQWIKNVNTLHSFKPIKEERYLRIRLSLMFKADAENAAFFIFFHKRELFKPERFPLPKSCGRNSFHKQICQKPQWWNNIHALFNDKVGINFQRETTSTRTFTTSRLLAFY